jgi:hypothetical protein
MPVPALLFIHRIRGVRSRCDLRGDDHVVHFNQILYERSQVDMELD